MYSILNGADCTAEAIHGLYSDVFAVSKLCKTVDLPLFERSIRFITNYLKGVHVLMDLLGQLLK